MFHLGESGHDRAQQQQQLFSPQLISKKMRPEFFPNSFFVEFLFLVCSVETLEGGLTGNDVAAFQQLQLIEIRRNITTRFGLNFVFLSFLEKRNIN